MADIIDAQATELEQRDRTPPQEAIDAVSGLIERNLELEQIFENLQPLLYELSVALYGENDEPVTLNKLIEDGVRYIKGDYNA